jgi:hypothetical protein
MPTTFLAFSADRMNQMIQDFKMNGKDAPIKFYTSGDHIVVVTDEFSSEEELKTNVDLNNKYNQYHGSSQNWADYSDLCPMNVSELIDGSVSPEVALYRMIGFGKKTVEQFSGFASSSENVSAYRKRPIFFCG